MKRMRIVPTDEVTQEQIDLMVYQLDWSAVREIEAGEEAPHEIIYRPFGERALHIHQIDDYLLDVRYFEVRGEDIDEAVAELRERLPTITIPDAEHQFEAAASSAERQHALGWAALLATSSPDPRVLNLFTRGFADPEPLVRRMAVLGVGYIGWPEFAAPLRALASLDPNDDVRREASAMADALAQKGNP